MSDASLSQKKKGFFIRGLLYGLVLLFLVLGVAVWYVTTDAFQQRVRSRLIEELQKITGARVELASIHTTPLKLRVEVRDLTVHGLEPATAPALAHFESITARVKILSVFGGELGFDSFTAEHPVIHVIAGADGVTNLPDLGGGATAGPSTLHSATDKLFDLSIRRLTIRNGELFLNDRHIPLNVSAGDVTGTARYSSLRRNYWIDLSVGKAETTWRSLRPVELSAAAKLRIGRNAAEIDFLKLSSGGSQLELRGKITDFSNPKVEGDYKGNVDLAKVFSIAGRQEISQGTLTVQGNGKWQPAGFYSDGNFTAKNLASRSRYATLRDGEVGARFRASGERLTLSDLQGRVFDGSFTGDADVQNWLAVSPTPASRKIKEPTQKGIAHVRFSSLATAQVLAVIARGALTKSPVQLAGTSSGMVEARWIGSVRNADMDISVDAVPPARPLRGVFPVAAKVRGKYYGSTGDLDLAALELTTADTQVHASGRLSSRAAVAVSIMTRDLNQWAPFLNNQSSIPITLSGPATFNGIVRGTLADPQAQGQIQTQGFDYHVPLTERTPPQLVHFDSLNTAVQVSSHSIVAHNGVLRHGYTVIRFGGNADWNRGELTSNTPFAGNVALHAGNVSELLQLTGYNYPVTGTVNLMLHASGTLAEPHADGHIEVSNAYAYEEPVQHASADLRLQNTRLALSNLQVLSEESRIAGQASLDHLSRAIDFELTGSNFRLSRFPQLQRTGFPVEGSLRFRASGSGTLDQPSVRADIELQDLTFDSERAGNFHLPAVTQGRDLHVTGRSAFEHAVLNLDGTVRLERDMLSDVTLHFTHLDVDPLLHAYLRGRLTGHSAVAGTIRAQGPLRVPRLMNITAEMPDLFLNMQNVKLTNKGPLRFSVVNQVLRVDQFGLTGADTDLTASGTAELAGENLLDLQARGNVNLSLIQTLNPSFTSTGTVALDLRINGTTTSPVTHGQLQIVNASIAYIDLPSALSGLNGTLVFNQDRLKIESLSGRVGGGNVSFGGFASLYQRRLNFDLTMHGEDVRLRYPPGVSANTTADVAWTGTPAASTLSGDVTVNRLAIASNFDFSSYIVDSGGSARLPQTNPLLNGIKLDLRIVTAPELQMQTSSVRVSGDADLHLRGTAAKPVVLGRADVLEGEAYFNGTRYRLERGDITFTNPLTTTPIIDLQASTRVRDYDVTLTLNGEFDKLSINYRSEPPLPTADVIALLALGRTQEESAQLQQSGQQALGQAASNLILAEALNSAVSDRVQRLFGGSRIKIDPQGLSTETSALARGPQVTIEQQLAHNITVTYSTNVGLASQQIIQVEYNINRNVSIVALRDQNGVVSFDVRVRRRKQ